MKISGSVLAFGGRFRESMQNKTALTTALGRPNREQVTTERPSATTTLQALALTNGEVLSKLIKDGAADAVSVASLLHYNHIERDQSLEGDFSSEGNVEFLSGRRPTRGFSKIRHVTLTELKGYLGERGIECRQDSEGSVNG